MTFKIVNVLSFLFLLGLVQAEDLQCFVSGECSNSDIIDISPVIDEVYCVYYIVYVLLFWTALSSPLEYFFIANHLSTISYSFLVKILFSPQLLLINIILC